MTYLTELQRFAEDERASTIPIPTELPHVSDASNQSDGVQPASYQGSTLVGHLWNAGNENGIWQSGVELTLLDPRYTASTFGIYDDETSMPGVRASLGRESANGIGWKSRFWYTESDVDVGTDFAYFPAGLKLSAIRFDLDAIYKRFTFPQVTTSLETGAGFSIARLAFEPEGEFQSRETAAGPTVFLDGRTVTYQGPRYIHTFVWKGRLSSMGSTWKDRGRLGRTEGNGGLTIAEAAIGIEWIRKFEHSHLAFSFLFEVQSWDTTYFNDISFVGDSFGLNYYW